jgi:hypothetical protein
VNAAPEASADLAAFRTSRGHGFHADAGWALHPALHHHRAARMTECPVTAKLDDLPLKLTVEPQALGLLSGGEQARDQTPNGAVARPTPPDCSRL